MTPSSRGRADGTAVAHTVQVPMPALATSSARQVAVLFALVAVLFGVLAATTSGAAEAWPKQSAGCPCWVSDYGWMTCYDV